MDLRANYDLLCTFAIVGAAATFCAAWWGFCFLTRRVIDGVRELVELHAWRKAYGLVHRVDARDILLGTWK